MMMMMSVSVPVCCIMRCLIAVYDFDPSCVVRVVVGACRLGLANELLSMYCNRRGSWLD
jgi:hypothetical protein